MVAGADGGRKWLPMVWMVPFLFTYVNTAKVIVHVKRENFMQFELNLKNTLIRKKHTPSWQVSLSLTFLMPDLVSPKLLTTSFSIWFSSHIILFIKILVFILKNHI